MKQIFLTCSNCSNRFLGAAATPSIIMRIEMPCPTCKEVSATPYGFVMPFFEELFYLNYEERNPHVSSKFLNAYIGMNNSKINEEKKAKITEILNAYLMWLDKNPQTDYKVMAPPGCCIYFLPPEISNTPEYRKFLREKLQAALQSENIEEAFDAVVAENPSVSTSILGKLITKLKDQGVTVAFLIERLIDLLG
jgi:hypothetical protein